MSEYAKCPGEGCAAKVRIKEENTLDFCCVPCFQYTWKMMFSEDDEPNPSVRGHSGECWDRQAARLDEPVVEGDFTVRFHLKAPAGRDGEAVS